MNTSAAMNGYGAGSTPVTVVPPTTRVESGTRAEAAAGTAAIRSTVRRIARRTRLYRNGGSPADRLAAQPPLACATKPRTSAAGSE